MRRHRLRIAGGLLVLAALTYAAAVRWEGSAGRLWLHGWVLLAVAASIGWLGRH